MSGEPQVLPGLELARPRRRWAFPAPPLGRYGAVLGHALGRVPPHFLALGAGVLAFALVTLLLSALSGAPLMVPRERVSPALGVPAAAPLGLGLLGYLAVQLAVQRWRRAPRSRAVLGRQIATDLVFLGLLVVVTYFHFHIKMWLPVLSPHLYDAFYFAVDEQLRGLIDAAGGVRAAVAAWLPAADLWYQGAQLSLFVLSFWLHAIGDRRWHHHNVTALLINLMLGPLAYLVAPAVGPVILEAGPNAAASAAQQEI